MKRLSLLLMLLFLNNAFATTSKTNTYSESENNSVQIVRLNFTAPNGASRELLLGFTSDNSASDGVDYGYDATVSSPFANDLNWIIEENRYVIQGVGAFDDSKQYPFGLYSEMSGNTTIELTSLESFNSQIDVFIYDALLDTYTNINDTAYTNTIDAGNYTDRFYIAFKEPETNNDTANSDLDTGSGSNNFSLDPRKDPKVSPLNFGSQLKVSANNNEIIKEINIYNYNGTRVQSIQNINKNTTYINFDSEERSLIVHIITNKDTFIKQIALGKQ